MLVGMRPDSIQGNFGVFQRFQQFSVKFLMDFSAVSVLKRKKILGGDEVDILDQKNLVKSIIFEVVWFSHLRSK